MPFVLSLISVLETEGYAARCNRWRAEGQGEHTRLTVSNTFSLGAGSLLDPTPHIH